MSRVPATVAGTAFTCPRCRVVFVIPRLPPVAVAPPLPAGGPLPPHLTAAPPILPPPVKSAVKPSAGSEATAGDAVERIAIDPQRGRIVGQVLAGVLLGLFGLLVIGAVAIPVYYFRQSRTGRVEEAVDESPADDQSPALGEASSDSPAAENAGNSSRTSFGEDAMPQGVAWTNATDERGISRGGIRVRVVRAEFGEVYARDERNMPTSAGPGKFLQIYVQVENRADADLHYVSWYGNRFQFDNRPVAARLWDDAGQIYRQQDFERSESVQGHTAQTTAARGERVRDAIIFTVPQQIVQDSARTLRLELPGGAVGTRFFYRFEIPRSMLSEF
jgi:hypothetical protein